MAGAEWALVKMKVMVGKFRILTVVVSMFAVVNERKRTASLAINCFTAPEK